MSDLISREAAIEAVEKTDWFRNEYGEMVQGSTSESESWYKAEDIYKAIAKVPSAEPAPVVAYICDRRRCAICSGPDGGCDHTTDIKHAAHFKNVAGQYFERPYMEEEDDGNL